MNTMYENGNYRNLIPRGSYPAHGSPIYDGKVRHHRGIRASVVKHSGPNSMPNVHLIETNEGFVNPITKQIVHK